jgi:hypothetical protein
MKTFGSSNNFFYSLVSYWFTYRTKKDSSPSAQNDTPWVVILNPSTVILSVSEGSQDKFREGSRVKISPRLYAFFAFD